jgi:hypothetical protein
MGTHTHLFSQLTIQCEKFKTKEKVKGLIGGMRAQIIDQGNTLAHIINYGNTHTLTRIFNQREKIIERRRALIRGVHTHSCVNN